MIFFRYFDSHGFLDITWRKNVLKVRENRKTLLGWSSKKFSYFRPNTWFWVNNTSLCQICKKKKNSMQNIKPINDQTMRIFELKFKSYFKVF